MRRRTFILITRHNTILLDEKSLKNTNTIQLPFKMIQKKGKIKTLGAKPQQGDLLFVLAEEEEHPWLRGQPHDPRP